MATNAEVVDKWHSTPHDSKSKDGTIRECRFRDYWQRDSDEDGMEIPNSYLGSCRRYAPKGIWLDQLLDEKRLNTDHLTTEYLFPRTGLYDWCGDFSARA